MMHAQVVVMVVVVAEMVIVVVVVVMVVALAVTRGREDVAHLPWIGLHQVCSSPGQGHGA
jgi:hypothetical protein